MSEKSKHPLIGKRVICRAPESGVFLGRLVANDEHGVTLKGAQRIWSWQGALDTATLAAVGPSSAVVSPKVPGLSVIPDGRECFAMSKASRAVFRNIGVWSV